MSVPRDSPEFTEAKRTRTNDGSEANGVTGRDRAGNDVDRVGPSGWDDASPSAMETNEGQQSDRRGGAKARGRPDETEEEPRDAPARRQRRRLDLSALTGGPRRKGMLGLLNQTLSKAKEEEAKRKSDEAAQRRASLEARLQTKMRHDSEALQSASRAQHELRSEALVVRRLAELISTADAEHRLRKAQKRRLASFLVTPGELALSQGQVARRKAEELQRKIAAQDGQDGESRDVRGAREERRGGAGPDDMDVDDASHRSGGALSTGGARLAAVVAAAGTATTTVISPDIPTVLAPPDLRVPSAASEPDAHPVYFLPQKLLAADDGALDDQEDRTDEALARADEEWAQRRALIVKELERLKASLRAKVLKMLGEARETDGKTGAGDGHNGTEAMATTGRSTAEESAAGGAEFAKEDGKAKTTEACRASDQETTDAAMAQ